MRSRPEFSIEFGGDNIRYFAHEAMFYNSSFKEAVLLVGEWVYYNVRFWLLVLQGLLIFPTIWVKNKRIVRN